MVQAESIDSMGQSGVQPFESVRQKTPSAVDATPWTRYRNYVDEGLVDMGLRYGSRAFQGMFIGLSDLPGGMKLKGVVGKSNFNRPAFEGAMSFTSSGEWRRTLVRRAVWPSIRSCPVQHWTPHLQTNKRTICTPWSRGLGCASTW